MVDFNRIEQMRKELGITYDKLSKLLDFKTPSASWRILHGERQMKAWQLKKLIDILGLPITELFKDDANLVIHKGGSQK